MAMRSYEVGNSKIRLRLAVGPDPDGLAWRKGIFVESIRDLVANHEYLTAADVSENRRATQTYLFEYAINNGPSRISSRDLEVTHVAVVNPGRAIRIEATDRNDGVSFHLGVVTDEEKPAVLLSLGITKTSPGPSAFLRMVFPRLLGLRARGGPCDTTGMVPIEIGSKVCLAETFTRNGRQDDFAGTFNPGTIGMPYQKEAKRIGLPTAMNTMEVASFYSSSGGGLFVADIDHDVFARKAPVQLTMSLVSVEGFWVCELPHGVAVETPRVAIGVHPDGDWHAAVDYYVEKHRALIRPFPQQPSWFADQAAIYTHSAGGAGGMYLANTHPVNLSDGGVYLWFEIDDKWPDSGPIPMSQAGLAPAGAPLAAVVRNNKDEDLFVVDNQGAIAWMRERDNGPFDFAQQISPTGVAPVGAWLAAVPRHPAQVDVFYFDKDGALWTTFGPATTKESWLSIKLSQPIARPGAPLATIARNDKDVDVFFVDKDGAVCWTFERNNEPWLQTPRKLTNNQTCAVPSHLAAVARNAVQTDVFFVDRERKVTTLFKTTPADDGAWQSVVLSGALAPAGAGIAAIARADKDEDVFVIGDRGAIQHTKMRNNGAWSAPAPLVVEGQRDTFAPAGAPITAVATRADRTDLFFADVNGVFVRLFEAAAAPWARMDAVPPHFTVPGAATAAVLRNTKHLDTFVVFKGRLRSFRELTKLLDEAQSLGANIVYLYDYWEGRPRVDADASGRGPKAPLYPPYFNKGDYWPREDLGGEPAFREGIAKVHEHGGKVILYVEPFIIWFDSHVARTRPDPNHPKDQGEYLAGYYPNLPPLSVISGDQRHCDPQGQNCWTDEWKIYPPYNHTMVPALPDWQRHVERVVERLATYGADGIFLDSFGWQMNYPMYVKTLTFERQYWPIDYARGVLDLTDKVRNKIGQNGVVLTETPAGPVSRHCHGGVSADFAFHVADGQSDQTRITASPVRYGLPEIRYFSNGGPSMNRLHQIYAAGHGLALCYQHIAENDGKHIPHIKTLVDIRRTHADALIRGHQTYQPTIEESRDDVAAYYYRGSNGPTIITAVNTCESADFSGRLRLRAEDAGSAWIDHLTRKSFTATGTSLPITIPRGGTWTTTNLLVLLPLLRRGSRAAVGTLQTQLKKLGFVLKIDQIFGDETERTVIQFQRQHSLKADGIVGPMTWDALANATK